jgi:RNA recognition motif-containing protein
VPRVHADHYFTDILLQRLRNHPEYRFEQRGEPKEELASRLANRKNKTEDDTESPSANRQSAISASPRAVSNTIWVGNLPPDVSYGMLTSIFASFGTVISTHMVVQHLNHKRRHDAVELVTDAYAYVEFDHSSSAVAAVKAVVCPLDSSSQRFVLISSSTIDPPG